MEELLGYRCVQHFFPVWGDKANYVMQAIVPDQDNLPMREQLWARKLEGGRFELCCIPYFLRDLALGDIMLLDDSGVLKKVAERSGRYVFRIWLGDSSTPLGEFQRELDSMGALQEWRAENLGAIDLPDKESAWNMAKYLWDRLQKGELEYETGQIDPDFAS